MLTILKLRRVTAVETTLPYQHVFDTINQAFIAEDGRLGSKSLPLISTMGIYKDDTKTIITIHSSLVKGLKHNKRIAAFFIALGVLCIASIVLLNLPPISIVVAPLMFWLFGSLVVHTEATHTKKVLQEVLDSTLMT